MKAGPPPSRVAANCGWRSFLPLLLILSLAACPQASAAGKVLVFSARLDVTNIVGRLFGGEERGGIFAIRRDGTGLRLLTFNPLFDGEAAFSPDGTQIVFASRAAGMPAGTTLAKTNLFVMDVNRNLIRRVTTSPFADVEPIGACSVVTKNVEAFTINARNPCRKLKDIEKPVGKGSHLSVPNPAG